MREAVELSCERIAPRIRQTPCRRSAALSRATGADVHLKLESLQTSGSFKLRGVLNKLLCLSPEERRAQLVAASTGNHGAAFAHAVQQLGLDGRLFLPRTASPAKLEAIEGYGVPYELVGDDCVETEAHAAAYAREHGGVWVSPYNDPDVVAGQGTVAVELLDQLGALDAVLVPVGGGGLASGIGAYLNAVVPGCRVIGCQPISSCVMCDSVTAGHIVEVESRPTLSDATAGGIEPGSITFDLCRRHVAEFILLTESEIAQAIRLVYEHEGQVVEGGAALPVAAVLKAGRRLHGARIALVITGSRIDQAVLRRILARGSRSSSSSGEHIARKDG